MLGVRAIYYLQEVRKKRITRKVATKKRIEKEPCVIKHAIIMRRNLFFL